MKLMVIVNIDNPVIDPYGNVKEMTDHVGGEIVAYDVSDDGKTWKYSGKPVAKTDR